MLSEKVGMSHFWASIYGTVMTVKFLKFFQSKEDQTQVVSNLKTISMSSSKLLLAAKALSTDPSSPNLKNQLAAAARWPAFFFSILKQRELCLPTFLNCLPLFSTSVPLCPQGSDRQYQPAHHHVHSAGSRSEGVWQCAERAGGNNRRTTTYHVSSTLFFRPELCCF